MGLTEEQEQVSECHTWPHPRPLGHQEKQVNLYQSGRKVVPVGCLNSMRGCSDAWSRLLSEHQCLRNGHDLVNIPISVACRQDDQPHRMAGGSSRGRLAQADRVTAPSFVNKECSHGTPALTTQHLQGPRCVLPRHWGYCSPLTPQNRHKPFYHLYLHLSFSCPHHVPRLSVQKGQVQE